MSTKRGKFHYAAAVFSLAATALLLSLICLVQGLSVSGLLYGVIFQHIKFSSIFSTGAPATRLAAPVAVVAFCFSVLYVWQRRRIESVEHLIPAAKIVFGLAVFYFNVANVYGFYSLSYAAPFLWVTLLPATGEQRLTFPRALVCMLAIMQALQVYPVAGSQVSSGSFLMLPAAAICLGDGLAALRRNFSDSLQLRRALTAVTCLVLIFVSILYARQINWFYRSYASHVPLNLPGAKRIRLPQGDAATLQSLVKNIKARCDNFVSMPGVNSLYFWTQIEPPTTLNTTTWMTLLSEEQHKLLFERLDAHRRPCVIYHAQLAEGWLQGRDVSKLTDYLQYNYQEAQKIPARVGEFELKVKRTTAPH